MRTLPLLALLSLAAAPAAAQGVVIPLRCDRECPANGTLPRMAVDSVKVWATVDGGVATTRVEHQFHNVLGGTVEAAFFFPLPVDATISSVSVYVDGKLEEYNRWSGPDESRWIAEGLVRWQEAFGLEEGGLEEYAGTALVHIPLRLAARSAGRVQISYRQPVVAENGTFTYRYPLSAGAVPAGHLTLGATVKTETGFRDLRSPSHAVQVEWGTELRRCPPTAACGYTSGPSQRVKTIRLTPAPGDWTRDFEIVYTPADAADERRSASHP
ncbi:MAG TPA: VIT domain-containing protein [Longimicrobium sp.]|nr:VIT domain-containing protein [Longimicrobium sp.]